MKSILTTIVVILVIWLGWYFWTKPKTTQAPSSNNTNNSTQTQNQNQNSNESANSQNEQTTTGSNNIVGVLKASDNEVLGNLMVETENQNIYLSTSRDFDMLLGQKVTVIIDGDLTNFTLVDIKPFSE